MKKNERKQADKLRKALKKILDQKPAQWINSIGVTVYCSECKEMRFIASEAIGIHNRCGIRTIRRLEPQSMKKTPPRTRAHDRREA